MKVILLQDVKGIGRRNEVKEVRDGYAMNYLIPKKLAAPATKPTLTKKQEEEKKLHTTIDKYKKASEALKEKVLDIPLKTGKAGEVFGSITKDDIQNRLLQEEAVYKDVEVLLPQPIKSLGQHAIEIKFGHGIRGQVRINVREQK